MPGEIVVSGASEQLLPDTVEMNLFGKATRMLDLRRLIDVKRAAGRTTDLEAIAELEALPRHGRPRKRRPQQRH